MARRGNRANFSAPWILLLAALVVGGLAALRHDAEATTFRQVLADTSRDTDPTPSPDGKWLAFSSNRGTSSELWLMPVAGGTPMPLTSMPDSTPDHRPSRIGTPAWAPDGKSLLFISTHTGNYNIYSVAASGGEARAMSSAPGSHRFAVYAPDGKTIAFPSNRAQPGALFGFNIYLMDSAGETPERPARQLTHLGGSPGHPTWSPDGSWVAFVAKAFDTTKTINMGGGIQMKENALFAKYHIYKVPAAGGKEIRLTGRVLEKDPPEEIWPSWSPDGKWIAYTRVHKGSRDVWILDVKTLETYPLTTTGDALKPTWAYDGATLYFTRTKGLDEDIWVAENLVLPPPRPKSKAAPSKGASTPKKASSKAPTKSTR